MEKYRQFADGGTGVNPFLPPWAHHKPGLFARVGKASLLFPLAIMRLALFVLAYLWLYLSEMLCGLIFIGVLRYFLYRLLTYVGCCMALLALGILPVGDVLADHRRLKIPPPKTGGASVFNATRGTIIVANLQGMTDVLYLAMKVCPTFVFPAIDGSPVAHGLLGALRRAGARRIGMVPAKPQKLADIVEEARASWRGPVVVFAEGARTNGSGVLSWKARTFEGAGSPEQPVPASIVAIEYSKKGAYTPHHVVGTAFRHVWWLCMQPWHTVRSVWLPRADVLAATKGKELAEQVSLLRTVLVRMLPGAVEVAVPAEKHPEFMAYWDASQKKGYTHKKTS